MAQGKNDASQQPQAGMKQGEPRLPDRAEEARNLANEGMEERNRGNKEEGDFLLNQAKQLDPGVTPDAGSGGKK